MLTRRKKTVCRRVKLKCLNESWKSWLVKVTIVARASFSYVAFTMASRRGHGKCDIRKRYSWSEIHWGCTVYEWQCHVEWSGSALMICSSSTNHRTVVMRLGIGLMTYTKITSKNQNFANTRTECSGRPTDISQNYLCASSYW